MLTVRYVQGELQCLVYNTGKHTFFGQAATLVASADRPGRLQGVLATVGNFCVISILVMSIIELIVQLGVRRSVCEGGEDKCPVLSNVLVLIVGGIPIAMPTVLSVTLAIGAMELAKKDAIVTRLTAIEELASMDILCSDKTGTLTLNKLSVENESVVIYDPSKPLNSHTSSDSIVSLGDKSVTDKQTELCPAKLDVGTELCYDAADATASKGQRVRVDSDSSEEEDCTSAERVAQLEKSAREDVALCISPDSDDAIEVVLDQWSQNSAQIRSEWTLKRYVPFDPVGKRTISEMRHNVTGQFRRVAKGAPQVSAVGKCRDER